MSRFFEALKQASLSQNVKRENAASDSAESNSMDISALLNEPEASEAAPRPVQADLSEAEAASATEPNRSSVEQFLPSLETPQNGSIGLSIQTVLDRRTRLIPNSADPAILEPYRHLRTTILQAWAEKEFRTLLVVSSESKEGKTVTVLNLAYVFSMLPSFKVLVVDGDLRSGTLSKSLGVKGRAGLSDLLEGSARLDEVVLKSDEIPFCFMVRGTSKVSPPELLHSSRWANQAKRISEHFDLVLVDSPPVGFVTDAQLLALGCEAVVLVARAFKTSQESLEKLTQDFQRYRVLGTVLNGGENMGRYRAYRNYFKEDQ